MRQGVGGEGEVLDPEGSQTMMMGLICIDIVCVRWRVGMDDYPKT